MRELSSRSPFSPILELCARETSLPLCFGVVGMADKRDKALRPAAKEGDMETR